MGVQFNPFTGNLDLTGSSGGGTVTSIATGTGLTGGPITTSGTISLADTAVVPGTYGSATQSATVVIDQQGRITSASNTTITGVSPVGSALTSADIWVGNGSNIAAPVAVSGDISLSNAGVTLIQNNAITTSKIADNQVTLTSGAGQKITGTLPIGNGGTGQVTANTALNALLPSQTGNADKGLVTDGSNTSWIAVELQANKGIANGYASLDSGGKVPVAQLPNSVMTFEGIWNASTNTPTLADGVGDAGMVYLVTVSGTQDLGSGSQTFAVGDWVVANSSVIWQKSINSNAVVSVNGATGVVTVNAINQLTGDVTAGPASGSQSQAATLSSTGVTPGSYTIANITVDAKGRLSAASNGSAVTSVTAGTALNVGAGPGGSITTTGTLNLANTAVTPGSYTRSSITVDQQGRLTSASNGAAIILTSDVTGILPLANGGTNNSAAASAGSVVYSDSTKHSYSAVGTTGQAFVSGGTGTPTWFAPTAGSILFAGASGILQQDNANLFYDDTNDRLGVGIVTPQSRVHIDGGTATNTFLQFTNGTTTGTASGDGFAIGISTTGAVQIRQRENTTLGLYTNNLQAMVITATGSVGIQNNTGTALATTATGGFLYIPTSAGTPTGVPVALNGTAPIELDTTNNKFYYYTSGAWQSAINAAEKGAANGVATLDGTSKLTASQLPTNVPLASTGDLNETSFTGANNQTSAADVTGLLFSSSVRSFRVLASASVDATSDLFETFEILGVNKGATWEINTVSMGDVSQVTFSITNAGQIQYMSGNYAGFVSLTIKFRAITLGV